MQARYSISTPNTYMIGSALIWKTFTVFDTLEGWSISIKIRYPYKDRRDTLIDWDLHNRVLVYNRDVRDQGCIMDPDFISLAMLMEPTNSGAAWMRIFCDFFVTKLSRYKMIHPKDLER